MFVARLILSVYRHLVERLALRLLSSLAVIVLSAYMGLYLLTQSLFFQHWLITRLSQRTGYDIEVSGLRLTLPFRFVASSVKISKATQPILQAPQMIVTLSPADVLSNAIGRIQLRQPTLHLDLRQLLDSSNKNVLAVAIRHLDVDQGVIVLKTGDGRSVEFRSVSLNVNDLNLGKTTGMTFHAEIPSFKSRAEIRIHGEAEERQAEIRIHQTPASSISTLLTLDRPPSGLLRAAVKLRKNKTQELAVLATGDLNQFSVGNDKLTGQFDLKTEIDPSFQMAAVAGQLAVNDFTAKLGPTPLATATQPARAMFAGQYSIAERLLTLKALHLESGWGTADATASLAFIPQLKLTNGRATLRHIPAEALQQFLPEPLRAAVIKGMLESELEFDGLWPTLGVKGVARTRAVQIKTENFSLTQLSFKAPFEWTNGSLLARDVQVQANSLLINRNRTSLSAGEIAVSAALKKESKDPLNIAGNVRILRGRFSSADGSKVGENIHLKGRFETATTGEKQVTSLAANLEVEQGEVLWGKFFGDLRTPKPAVDFSLDYLAADDAIRLRRLKVSLADMGSVEIAGNVERVSSAPVLRLQTKSDDLKPSGVFEFFIRDTLKRSYPILDRLKIAGQMNFSIRLERKGDQWLAEGNLRVRAGDLREESNQWQIGPFDLALPFRVQLPAAAPPAAPPQPPPVGNLAIASARAGSESIRPLRTTVSAWNNVLEFRQTIPISIYGGTVEIGNLRWPDFINNPKTVSLSLTAKSLQLQKLTTDLGWYRFAGTLSGSIPKMESADPVLRTQGEIQMEVFGGKVRIAPVEVQNPFSSLFSLRLHTRFEDIDLEVASETFEFGRISGILEGSVSDLVVTNGQPAQFMADIHTVAKKGASQWISVEALNKITVLSSGNDAGALYGGLAGLFDNFRYSKLGFKAALKNDKLTLRGIESRDGKEYLVVGTFLPPTVNIISHTQQISFAELLRRLERIKKSGKAQIK